MSGAEWVDIDRVEEPLHLLRSADTESQDFKDLVASMRADGFWESRPLDVSTEKLESGDTVYILNDGMQRLSAARMLGLPKVPVSVCEKTLTEATRLERSIVAQATAVKMRPVEYGRGLAKMLELDEFKGITLVDLARRVRKETKWVTGVLKLAKLEGPAVELVDAGKIPLANAQALVEVQKAGIPISDDLLAKSQSEGIEAFAETASAVLEQGRGERKRREPVAKLRPLPDVKAELDRAARDPHTPKGYTSALEWALRKDSVTAAAEGIEPSEPTVSPDAGIRNVVHWALGAGADPSDLSQDPENPTRKLIEECEQDIVGAIGKIGVVSVSALIGSSLDTVRRWIKRERRPNYTARRKILEAASHA